MGPTPNDDVGLTDRDLIPPDDPCPRCDGAGCPLCTPDPGAAADWAYDYQRDDAAFDAWRETH